MPAYDVTISCKPTCTCPDALKGNVCKHILFVMLRVLRLKRDDPLVWQKALLSGEVRAVAMMLLDSCCSEAWQETLCSCLSSMHEQLAVELAAC